MMLMSEIDVGERSEVRREAWSMASRMLSGLIGTHIQLYRMFHKIAEITRLERFDTQYPK